VAEGLIVTTLADMIEETRGHLLSGARDELNRLSAAITTTGATTATLDFAVGGIARGAVLGIDLEQVYVWAASGTTISSMQRGYGGSTAATHLISSLVYVNPRFSAFRIFQAINEELASYSSPSAGLFRVRTVDLTYSAARSGYDLTAVTDLIDVLGVTATGYTAGEIAEIEHWRVARSQVTTDFASGTALELFEGGYPGRNLRVAYAAPYTALAALGDDVAAVAGLHAQAHDIVPLGAAARLLAATEGRRATMDRQPEPRAAVDVPPGTARQAAGALLSLRDRRLKEESARLRAAWPRRVRRGVA
jgi:hypothetical protein